MALSNKRARQNRILKALPANVLGQIVKCLLGETFVSFEHHVLEEMSETAATIGIIL